LVVHAHQAENPIAGGHRQNGGPLGFERSPRRQQLRVCAYAQPLQPARLADPTNPIEAADLPLHACPGKGAAVLHRQQR